MELDLIDGADEAAAFTGLTRRKIYRLVEEGQIPHIRKGRRLYFRRSELDRAFTARSGIKSPRPRRMVLNGFKATGYVQRRRQS